MEERMLPYHEKPELCMLTGLPASGKSTLAQSYRTRGYEVLSSDKIRLALLGAAQAIPADKGETAELNHRVFAEIAAQCVTLLRAGRSVLIDATNLYAKNRMHLLRRVEDVPCRRTCVLVITPVDVCLKRNELREGIARVPRESMDRMLRSFECPHYREGWDRILPVADPSPYAFPFEAAREMDQKTLHPTLPLLQHLRAARQYAVDMGFPAHLQRVAYYHDIGKLYTQSFQNLKGEPTAYARYYGHENYSAYLYLTEFCCGKALTQEDFDAILYETALINYHMRPWRVWQNGEDAKEKDVALFGETFISELEMLHAADRYAH